MMKPRPILTLILASLVGGLCLYLEVKDGGNIDFYWKPAIVLWLAVVLAALATRRKKASAWLCSHWWFQIVVPAALFFLAVFLVRIHEPYPLSQKIGGRATSANAG